MENIDFYRQYHSHPVNKIIHFFCIPTIAFCFLNYLSLLKCKLIFDTQNIIFSKPYVIEIFYMPLDIFVTLFYCYYYSPLYWPYTVSSVMIPFYIMLILMAENFRQVNNNWISLTHILFISAWILQFIGHYIEGSRPALTDSISQAFLTAPAFAILEPMGFL